MSTTTITASSITNGDTIPHSTGLYLHTSKDLRLETRALPAPAADEIQVAIRSTTLCGSDLHYYTHFRNGSILVREPLCLGHEAAGDVVTVGSAVTTFKAGDRVAIECGVSCGTCELCSAKRYNLCPSIRFRSSGSAFPHFQGTLQERINHPAAWAHRLPPSISYTEGALLEPLAVAIHAYRRASFNQESSCLVLGAGAVGLMCALVARVEGCKKIAIADIDKGRVQFAVDAKFADVGHVVAPKRGTSVEESLAIAKELALELGQLAWPDSSSSAIGRFDRTFECTGVPSCLQASIYATSSGGKVLIVGMGTPNHTLPISEASSREVDLIPTWRYADCYPRAIEIAALLKDDPALPQLSSMVTHTFEGLERVPEAFEMAGKSRDAEGKLMVKVAVNF